MTPADLRMGAVQARAHLDAPDLARMMEAAADRWAEAECALVEERAACEHWRDEAARYGHPAAFRAALRGVGR